MAFATQPVIYEEDQYGNVETSDNSTVVTAYPATGNGPLSTPASVTLKAGVATFTSLAADSVGTITLAFSGGGFTSPASVPIVVEPRPAAMLVIQTQPSPTATAGTAFTVQPVIYEEDQFGNLETADDGTTITATLATGTGPLQGTTAFTTTGGIVSFTEPRRRYSRDHCDQVLGVGIAVGPVQLDHRQSRSADQLVIASQPSSTAAAGVAFVTQPVIYEEDQIPQRRNRR